MFSVILGLLVCVGDAEATGFEPKTSQEPLSNRSIDRRLVLGMGWFELSLGSTYKDALGYWNRDGAELKTSDGEMLRYTPFTNASWLYTTQNLQIRYGVLRRVELFWNLKSHYVELTNPALGTDIQQYGVGDPEFGVKFEVFRSGSTVYQLEDSKDLRSMVVYTNYKAPMGNESPGNYVGGPNTFNSVVLTTGTPDWTFGSTYKQVQGIFSCELDFKHTFRISNVTLYALETDMNQFSIRVKPGNTTDLKFDVGLQSGPLFLTAGAALGHRGDLRMGNTVDGFVPSLQLDTIEDSSGVTVDVNTSATINIGQRLDLIGRASIPIRGEDLMFFPLEAIHPTYGYTYSGTIAYRF